MTKEEFDNTKWRRGMMVSVIGKSGGPYHVVSVDFEDYTVGFYTNVNYVRLRYDEVELVISEYLRRTDKRTDK